MGWAIGIVICYVIIRIANNYILPLYNDWQEKKESEKARLALWEAKIRLTPLFKVFQAKYAIQVRECGATSYCRDSNLFGLEHETHYFNLKVEWEEFTRLLHLLKPRGLLLDIGHVEWGGDTGQFGFGPFIIESEGKCPPYRAHLLLATLSHEEIHCRVGCNFVTVGYRLKWPVV